MLFNDIHQRNSHICILWNKKIMEILLATFSRSPCSLKNIDKCKSYKEREREDRDLL